MSDQHAEFIKIENISKSYGVVKALRDVSFSVKKGEIHTVLGENGAGKSTLMKIISGETVPDSGNVVLDGVPIKTFTPSAAHAIGIYMVHQELAVFENLTVAENIYPYHSFKKFGKIDYKQLFQKTKETLDMFGLKTIEPQAQMASINLAGQQMVEILRCIAARPKVIILDEPTSGLNDHEAELLMDILRRLKDEGITILYISHRLKEIMQISDRISVLRDGEYVTTLINDENLTENDLIKNMVGRDLSESLYNIKTVSNATSDDVLLEVKDLSKKHALNSASLALHRGEILGVFGLEGSGVDKLSRMIYGLERKDHGEIRVKGELIDRLTPQNMSKRHVMYLNNNRKIAGLLLDMPVTDNVSLPILRKVSDKSGFIRFNELDSIASRFIKMFSIALPSLTTKPRNLSGGNQQKVMLSACLAPEPEILVVNEPTRGIDVGAKAEIHKFILQIASQGVGVLLFSSEMPELMSLSDRILVMRNNSITGEVSCEEFSEQIIMRYAAVDITDSEEIAR